VAPSARHHQVRDVHARDEEHESHGDAEGLERRFDVACDHLTQRADRETQLVVQIGAWMLPDEGAGERVTLGLGLREGRARRESSDERRSAKQRARREGPWQPDVHALLHPVSGREIDAKVGPRDADDLHVPVVDGEVPANDTGVALEPTLPQLVTDHDAQDDDVARVLCVDERAPERQGRRAEERQHLVGHSGGWVALHDAIDSDARVAALDL
jgi:hypothetical protein